MKLDHPIVPLLGRFLITYIFHLRYQRNRGLMTREVPKICLDIFLYRNIMTFMARAATTSDAFNAVAEPRRREILNYLAVQERPVGEIVATLRLAQPSVSKHLRVLRDVGLVRVRRQGRRMMYRTNPEAIRPLHEWASTFERYWRHQLNRVKERAEAKMNKSLKAEQTKEEK